MALICPRCRCHDAIQPVRTVFEGGTYTINSQGRMVGGAMSAGGFVPAGGYVDQQGTAQTELAKRFSPPRFDGTGPYWIGGCVATLAAGVVVGLGVLVSSALHPVDVTPTALATGVAVVVVSVVVFILVTRDAFTAPSYLDERSRHGRACDRWSRLHYCFRCDVIIDPTERLFFESHKLNWYLNKE